MQTVIELSRQQFAHSRAEVEKAIDDWMLPIKPPQKAQAKTEKSVSSPAVVVAQIQTQNVVAPRPSSLPTPPPSPQTQPLSPSKPLSSGMSSNAKHETVPKAHTPSISSDTRHGKAVQTSVLSSQPFKKALQEIKVEKREESNHHGLHEMPNKAMSLNALDHKHHHKNPPKEAQPNRVNELKNALASILATHKPKENSKENISEKNESKKEEVKKEEIKKAEIKLENVNLEEKSNKEISEEKLREMLKVE